MITAVVVEGRFVRREGIEPQPADEEKRGKARSGHSWACEGANSALWTAADVTALLSLLLSRWARATAFVSAKVRLPEPSR